MRPYIIIFSTMTIDGKIAAKDYYSELSCPFDKMRLHLVRSEVDAILVGANTVKIDDPKLLLKYAKGKNPIRVTISSKLDLDPSANIFTSPPSTILYTTQNSLKTKEKLVEELKKKRVIIRALDDLSTCNIAEDLYELGIKKVLIEGGGKTIWNFIKEGCYDEIRITISPKIFGNGVSIVNGEGFEGLKAPTLRLIDFKLCECKNEIHIMYKKL